VDNLIGEDSTFYTRIWKVRDQKKRTTLMEERPQLKEWFERYILEIINFGTIISLKS